MIRSTLRTSTLVRAVAFTALAAPATLSAQHPDTTRAPHADSAHTLTRVVIRATRAHGYAVTHDRSAMRTDTPLRDTPQAVTVVTHQLIADQAMQGMSDVARYAPGVTMASGEGHVDEPVIRGNKSSAGFFRDGVRDDAQYLRDLYNVDRVDVLKGSSAMIFGRGSGGGLVNVVTRQAAWTPVRTLTLESGSFDHRRGVVDVDAPLDAHTAARVIGMYERSGGFRDAASLTRYGINPTLAFAPTAATTIRLGYEHFDDTRRVDRGVPSYQGRPAPVDIATFFGNPGVNRARSQVNLATATIEHQTATGVRLSNRTTWGDYDVFYQNTYPGGAVNAAGTSVALSAYNHAIPRHNVMNVADATYDIATGPVRHTLLVGTDLVRQWSGQVRRTGYFADSTASFVVPVATPTVTVPVTFRPSATDGDNTTLVHDAAAYVQDQIALSRQWQAVAGVRYERFDIAYHDNRSGSDLSRADGLASPRVGLLFKPVEPVSLYASYGVSFLPGSGDQFSRLTITTASLAPERFTTREVGAKWDVLPDLTLTAAAYRLDRTNTSAPDPSGSGLMVQTGAQRTTGWELGANGSITRAWQMSAGVASQRATIVSATSAAKAGATVPLVPATTVSLWNRYQVARPLGLGLGVVRQSSVYAAVDNTVTLPAFTRLDGAAYLTLVPRVALQVNVENVLDARYYATSQGNNNIMPGTPRTLRVSLTTGF